MEPLNYKQALIDAIKKGYDFDATHVKTVPVKEVFQGKTIWEGDVEIFAINPPNKQPTFCFGWGFDTGTGKTEFVTVLAFPPIDTPLKAVQAYLVNRSKQK